MTQRSLHLDRAPETVQEPSTETTVTHYTLSNQGSLSAYDLCTDEETEDYYR